MRCRENLAGTAVQPLITPRRRWVCRTPKAPLLPGTDYFIYPVSALRALPHSFCIFFTRKPGGSWDSVFLFGPFSERSLSAARCPEIPHEPGRAGLRAFWRSRLFVSFPGQRLFEDPFERFALSGDSA